MLNFDKIYTLKISILTITNLFYFINCFKANSVAIYIPKFLDVAALQVQ